MKWLCNMRVSRYYLLFIAVIVFNSCKQNPTEIPIELNPLLIEEMVRDVSLNPGITVGTFNMLGSVDWNYALSVPDLSKYDKVPLVIALHWSSAGSAYEKYLRCQAEPGLNKLDAIIFAPDAGDFYFWEEANYSLILTLIEYAKKYWPIDENKIVVTGYSMGGMGTWFFGTNYAQLFSAAIPVGSYTNYNKKLKIPFYVIHGGSDQHYAAGEMIEKVDELKDLGSDIQLHIIDGYHHYMNCAYSHYLTYAADWLLNEVWDY